MKNNFHFTVMLVTFLFSLALGELILRIFFPLPPENLVMRKEILDINGLKPQIIYSVNPWGFRSLSMRSLHKADHTIRILCLGASTTQQYTHDTEDMWCSLLGKSLTPYFKESGFEIETLAFGVGGIRASDNLRWLDKKQRIIKPDIIITLLGINDLSWNGGENYSYSGVDSLIKSKQINIEKVGKEAVGRPASYYDKFKNICINNSAICAYIQRVKTRIEKIINMKRKIKSGEAIEWHSKNLPKLRMKRQDLPYVDNLSRHPDPIVEFTDAIGILHQVAKDNGSDLLALGQPVIWDEEMGFNEESILWFSVNTRGGPVRPGGKWLENEMAKYNSVQQDIAKQNGFQYVDLNMFLPKTTEVFIDDCHLTLHGSRLLANAILPTVKAMVLSRIDDDY